MSAAPFLFCFGLGYSAEGLARSLRAEGWRVEGTCREPQRRAELEALGYAAHFFDREHPLADLSEILAEATYILLSIPPDAGGDAVADLHGSDIARLPHLRWLGYLSTTGVYGDRQGEWVDESSDLTPSGERGQRRVAAEEAWLDLWRNKGVPTHLFRLAGIYGPGRSALDTVRQGRAQRIDKPGQVFSRIHVADITQVLRASMAAPHPGTAYNVCDDDPAAPAEVIDFACRLLGVEPPPLVPFEKAQLSPMARSFYAESKRVDNRRIKDELGVELLYPSYRTGLTRLLEEGS